MSKKPNPFLNRRTLSNLFLVCSGILFYMLLLNWRSLSAGLGWISGVLSPLMLGLALAYLLNIPMRWLERRLFARLRRKRAFSITLTYLLAALILYALGSLVFPQVWGSVTQLVANVQIYLDNLSRWVEDLTLRYHLDAKVIAAFSDAYEQAVQSITRMVAGIMPQLFNFSIVLGKGVFSVFTAIFFSIYCLFEKERLLFQCRKLIYAFSPGKRTTRVLEVLHRSDAVFSGFISGKLIDSLIIAVMCFAGMQFIKPELAMLISVIIGITNIIPVFGPFIGAIPSILLLLMIDPLSAFWFALFILLLQQLDGNLIGPKILGDSTGLRALWVLVSIVVGGGLFGFTGMLLGVPVCSVLYYLASDALAQRLKRRGLRAEGYSLIPIEETPEEAAQATAIEPAAPSETP